MRAWSGTCWPPSIPTSQCSRCTSLTLAGTTSCGESVMTCWCGRPGGRRPPDSLYTSNGGCPRWPASSPCRSPCQCASGTRTTSIRGMVYSALDRGGRWRSSRADRPRSDRRATRAVLRALHRLASPGAPTSRWRGVPLAWRNDTFEKRLDTLADEIDVDRLRPFGVRRSTLRFSRGRLAGCMATFTRPIPSLRMGPSQQ